MYYSNSNIAVNKERERITENTKKLRRMVSLLTSLFIGLLYACLLEHCHITITLGIYRSKNSYFVRRSYVFQVILKHFFRNHDFLKPDYLPFSGELARSQGAVILYEIFIIYFKCKSNVHPPEAAASCQNLFEIVVL